MLSLFAIADIARAQPTLDVDSSFDPGAGADRAVTVLALQADGSVVLGGLFSTFQGASKAGLVRVNSSGQIVPSFDANLTFSTGGVFAIETEDTTLLIGGSFTAVRGTARAGIARISADGAPDAAFAPVFTAPTTVTALKRDVRGLIYVAGRLTVPGRSRVVYLVRLRADGSIDPTFSVPDDFFDSMSPGAPTITGLAIDGRGRLLVTGELGVNPERAPNRPTSAGTLGVVRLFSDGSLDQDFLPTTAITGWPTCVAVQPDGRLILAGRFGGLDGSASVARLHANGAYDSDFLARVEGSLTYGYSANAFLVLRDGSFLIGGDFTGVAGQPRNALAVLQPSGALAGVRMSGGDPNGSVARAASGPDGTILIAGDFTSIGGLSRGRVARLRSTSGPAAIARVSAPGNVKARDNVALRVAATGAPPLTYAWSRAGVTLQQGTDSTLALIGVATSAGGTYTVRVTAADGTSATGSVSFTVASNNSGFDPTFTAAFSQPAIGGYRAMVLDDGRLILGGSSLRSPNTFGQNAVRFQLDGSVDSAFPGRTLSPMQIEPAVGGGIWLSGRLFLGGPGSGWIYRVTDNFVRDATFGGGPIIDGVQVIAPVADGGVGMIAGRGGQSFITVLRKDGTTDPTFAGGREIPFIKTTSDDVVLAVTPDRWVYVGHTVNGASFAGVTRYRPDGSVDTAFPGGFYSIITSRDGEVYLFDDLSSRLRRGIARVARDGELDPSFRAPNADTWRVATVDGGGRVWGIYGSKFVRLQKDGSLDPAFTVDGDFVPATAGRIVTNASGTRAYTLGITRTGIPSFSGIMAFSGTTGSGTSTLVNLSTRAIAGVGDDALIVGFVTSGLTSSNLLVRAVGPTLSTFGVNGAMTAARLQLFRGAVAGEVNEQWNTVPNAAAMMTRAGAFALPETSRDAALLLSVPATAYTATVTPQSGNSPGVGLAEIYDLGGGVAGSSRLVNLASRARAGFGDDALIAGFVLAGSGPRQVLIRGIGPGQQKFGVSGTVENPRLVLQQGTRVVASNGGWDDAAFPEVIRAAARSVNAFALDPNSGDAALLITLEPGAYTAAVSSRAGGTSGVGLVEIYEVVE